MSVGSGLGRVAVFDRGEGARRVARSIRDLARAGRAVCAIAVHGPQERLSRWVRDADEALEATGSVEEALRAARADTAWLGPAPLAERAAFAEACARAGVTFAGPSGDALRRLAADGGLEAIAREAGLAVTGAQPGGARIDDARRSEARSEVRIEVRIEVIVARDAHGRAEVVGVGDTSLRLGGVVVVSRQ